MNSIHGIIHDLADEETVIGGCTTAGEVIITLQSLVEQNNSLKEKLEQIEQIINETNRRESVLVNPEPKITVRSMGFDKIREVLEKE